MNQAYKTYNYNGYNILASTEYNDWELTILTDNNDIAEDFYNNEDIRFRTLKDAKAWTKTAEAKELINKYLKE